MINGSEWIDNPWNITFKPFTDLFANTVGNGQVFFLIPLVVLTVGLQIKTQNSMMTTMFMLCSGALLASGSMFVGASDMAVIFTIFAALGFVGMIGSILFQKY